MLRPAPLPCAARRTLIAALAGFITTVVVVAVPALRLAYRSSGAHLVLETTVTLVGFLVALLLFGRYRRSAALSDLLLVYALVLLSATALVFVTIPVVAGEEAGATAASWAALVVRLLGALLILAAAVAPGGVTLADRRPSRDLFVLIVGMLGLAGLTYVLSSRLPDVVEVQVDPEESARPVLDGHPLVLGVQVVALVCYAVAAVVFTRRADREGDGLLGWFGAGAALGAWARVAYLLFPSLYTDWFYAGDLLRLGMYILLLVGAVGEIRRYWEAQAAAAVDAERRRLARDLHDGVVQELGYIRRETRRSDPDRGERIRAAADRALDEARRAMSALIAAPDESLASTLRTAAAEVGDRYDVDVSLELDGAVAVEPELREALVRIAREAVANAARHAGMGKVSVTLTAGRLDIRDDGSGFDPGRTRAGGYGLTSMRERAESVGATVVIESKAGEGTSVAVTW